MQGDEETDILCDS